MPASRDFAGSLENTPAVTRNQPSISAAPRCMAPIHDAGPPPMTPSRSGAAETLAQIHRFTLQAAFDPWKARCYCGRQADLRDGTMQSRPHQDT